MWHELYFEDDNVGNLYERYKNAKAIIFYTGRSCRGGARRMSVKNARDYYGCNGKEEVRFILKYPFGYKDVTDIFSKII